MLIAFSQYHVWSSGHDHLTSQVNLFGYNTATPQRWNIPKHVKIWQGYSGGMDAFICDYRWRQEVSSARMMAIIERLMEAIKKTFSEEGGFMKGKGCVDQVFAIQEVVE